MHPYPGFHHWHSMSHWHRGPSRLFWFIIGAASTAWWLKYKDIRHHDRYFGHCFRPPLQAPPPPLVQSTVPTDSDIPRGDNTLGAEAPLVRRPRNIPEARPPQSPAPWGFGQQHQAQQWEEEKEHMWALGRQAGDTMTELSEATLDSVLSTVEALKAKLAEHRAQREQQQKLLDRQLEEQKKQPRHFV